MALRDRVVGLLYGFPAGLAATAGLFHVLVHTGSISSELIMGLYQISVAVLFLSAFIVGSIWKDRSDIRKP